jgi:TetR/AcrR family transcriptional regulator, cholesterol catabolism regulator
MKVGAEPSGRSKRDVILRVAAEEFGRHGFDATKWARIAEPAGIGNTALYHYFESKTHCLFTLLLESYEGWYDQWHACLTPGDDDVQAILDAVAATFRCTDAEATKHRLLLHEQGKLSTLHSTGRTKEAQAETLRVARRIEKMWVGFVADAMDRGSIPRQDPGVLAHAIIGLLQSVWGWYRPGGRQRLADLERMYCGYVRAMLFAV